MRARHLVCWLAANQPRWSLAAPRDAPAPRDALAPWPQQHWLANATLAVRTVASSRFARCEVHRVRLPDGGEAADWVYFDERPHVNVLVRTEADQKFVLFRQKKYALGGASTLAPVGGFIEDGEAPAAAARRELLEELGLHARRLRSLGSFVTSANRGGGRVHAFFADMATPASNGQARARAGDHERQYASTSAARCTSAGRMAPPNPFLRPLRARNGGALLAGTSSD